MDPPAATSIASGVDASTGSESGDAQTSLPPVPGSGTAAADDGVGPMNGCQRIDFVFVIDNSSSMASHQAALLESFGPFMDTISQTVQAQSYNIMVVDSDAGEDIERACEPCAGGDTQCGDWCQAKAQLDLTCEKTLGAGEVAPYTGGASNRVCGFPDGRRFIDSAAGPSTVKDLFACAAAVGIDGSSAEMPMSALVEALTTQAQPGGCNEGFLREDAILVTTVITDDYPVPHSDDDARSTGSPEHWYDAVIGAKGGNPDNVVMLGIVNTADATCVSGAGDPITHPTPRFIDFVDRFADRGLTGNICDASYGAFFEDAVALIDSACDEFTPEG